MTGGDLPVSRSGVITPPSVEREFDQEREDGTELPALRSGLWAVNVPSPVCIRV